MSTIAKPLSFANPAPERKVPGETLKETIASILSGAASVADALALSRQRPERTTEHEQSLFNAGVAALEATGSRRSAIAFFQAVGNVDIKHISAFCEPIQKGFIAIDRHVGANTRDLSPDKWDKPLLSVMRRALYIAEHIDANIGRKCLLPTVLKIAQANSGTGADHDCLELATDIVKYLTGGDIASVANAGYRSRAMNDAIVAASLQSNVRARVPGLRMAA